MENVEMDQSEAEEVLRIATEYCRRVTKTEEEAQKMLSALASAVQEQGAKLVHLGNVLFLILVRGKELVEVHTMGEEKQPRQMAKNFVDLANYLKGVGVKVAYTYSPDKKFEKLAKMVNLKVQKYQANVEGTMMNVYVVEL
jgi:hypothetical protein